MGNRAQRTTYMMWETLAEREVLRVSGMQTAAIYIGCGHGSMYMAAVCIPDTLNNSLAASVSHITYVVLCALLPMI